MKVYIDYSDFGRDLKLWIVDDNSERRKLLHYENGVWIASDIEGGASEQEPSLKLPGRLGDEVLKAMVEAFNARGFKPESGLKVEGRLEATERHLDDLRVLLKLKNKNP